MTENRDAGASVRQFTAELADAARDGAYDVVADALGILARAGSSRVPGEVAAELVGHCTAVVRARHPADPGAVFTVAVTDEEARPVEVDRLPPGPLAALRALLADLGEDDESRDIQLELAARGAPDEVVGVVIHLLVWLVELSGSETGTLPPLSCFAR
ncbi:hypothetical protein ACWEVP_00885 [Amycolatopsis sp. NPDC003865]